jgi:hypothetical protein
MNSLVNLIFFLFLMTFSFVIGCFSLVGLTEILKPTWLKPIQDSLKQLSSWVVPLWLWFALVLIFRARIFPWVQTPPAEPPFKALYFESWFFILRGFFYLLLASIFAWRIHTQKTYNGVLALVCVLIFGSFASYDWILSFTPDFHSTIFGLLTLTGGTLTAFALSLTRLKRSPEPQVLLDLNNLHLAMIAVWSYLVFMQYLTVWYANLPEEVFYFKSRFHGLSGTLAAAILIFQVFIPVPLLLFRRLKRNLRFTKRIAGLTLVIQGFYIIWLMGASA